MAEKDPWERLLHQGQLPRSVASMGVSGNYTNSNWRFPSSFLLLALCFSILYQYWNLDKVTNGIEMTTRKQYQCIARVKSKEDTQHLYVFV